MNKIKSIAIDRLTAHPANPNRMSKISFAKLVRNIERAGRYEPLIVRPEPEKEGFYQIINGHHRCKALKKLGRTEADCIVWDVDDSQTDILLATLNRLSGTDETAKKIALIKRLNAKLDTKALAKLLPYPPKVIQRLASLENPVPKLLQNIDGQSLSFAEPMVFFVTDNQKLIIERALTLASQNIDEKTKAAGRARLAHSSKRATALYAIAKSFINQNTEDSKSRMRKI